MLNDLSRYESPSAMLKEEFAVWATNYYRVRKPGPDDMYDASGKKSPENMQRYRDTVPLLANVNPAALQTIITHFNNLIDTFDDHYAKPKFKRTLLTDRPLAKKSSETLTEFCRELFERQQQMIDSGDEMHKEFNPHEIWRTVYVEAYRQYANATGHSPRREKGAISIAPDVGKSFTR